MLGKDAFQEADVFGISMPIVKHSYLVKDANDIPRIVREAFHITNTGRPGPVLIDLPKDITQGPFSGELHAEMDLPGYKIDSSFDQDKVLAIAEALSKSRRPVLLAGHGAIIADASGVVRNLAEKLNAPVTTTLLGKGAFPETHRLSLGMLGMHGTAYANKAMIECDLVMSIGSRFDDRIVGQQSRFCKDAVRIHLDVDNAEIHKMIRVHHWCVGDARLILEELVKHDVLLLPNDLRFSHPLCRTRRERCAKRQRTVRFLSLPRKNVIPAASKPGKPGRESRLCFREMQLLPLDGAGFRLALRLAGMTVSGFHPGEVRNPSTPFSERSGPSSACSPSADIAQACRAW